MSKALVIGDLHFGVKANSQEYLEFQIKWFEQELYKNIEKYNVEHLIYLGDINDSRISLSPLILSKERQLFLDIKNKFPKVTNHVILGNHDLYYRHSREIHSLEFLKDIGYNVYEDPTEVMIDNKKLLFLPWITKHDEEDIKLRLSNNSYDCIFGHLEVQGFYMTKGMVDQDGLDISLFEKAQKVFSGHYHIRGKRKNVQYVGTPYEMNFSDSNITKGIELLDFEDLSTKFVKSKYIPRHLSFSSDDYKFDDLTKKLINNNLLKITLCEKLSEVEKIEYQEKVNSLKPFKVIFEDEGDIDIKVSDTEMQNSIKDTLSFLQEYCDIIEIDEGIDKKDIMDTFKQYYNKTQI